MSSTITFPDPASLSDARTYLARAARVDDTAVRLVLRGGVLALYTAALSPRGLMDRGFTVLGLRTMRAASGSDLDIVVPVRSILDRIATPGPDAGPPLDLALPDQRVTTVWAGISPPRSGWLPIGDVSAATLVETARRGVADVADAVPEAAGDHVVHSIRQAVWTRPIGDRDDLPSGAAFAADALGFIPDGDENVPIFASGSWVRLSPRRGHVLARRSAV
ncbi:hypothetical protein CLV49_3369 [Labedella gwakjiensis]|uniref:Uncharacterized protein n=1 Tax=Labedella gwakjiensis TaxID=390269 RepID=A0A2P8H0J2_9MICO|nr:hypothetical protein [Labedella gwakjiensis]PSL39722.1 hypothetical protein CLV49_3369 [Labedella gwakjiensis]RUQ85892.1 hypothetical protein ELQ93_02410 [Labedella gwakjiensis]